MVNNKINDVDEFDDNFTSRSGSAVSHNVVNNSIRPKSSFNNNNNKADYQRKQSSEQNEKNEKKDGDENEEENDGKRGCKGMLKFLMTNIGLIILVILYVIGGAFLFQLLEQHNSIQNCQEGEGESESLVTEYKMKLYSYIRLNVDFDPWLPSNNITNKTKVGPAVYNPVIDEMLTTFRTKVLQIRTNYTYYGQDCVQNNLWNYQSAILFALTVVTTIGYGHVAPSTWE